MKASKRSTKRTIHGARINHVGCAKRADVPDESRSALGDGDAFVKKIANIEREDTGDGFDIFEFLKLNGRRGTCLIPRDKATDLRAVTLALQQKNAKLPLDTDGAVEMVKRAIDKRPKEFRLHVRTAGWQENAFVLLDRVIQFRPAALKIYPPTSSGPGGFVCSAERGTLESWKAAVAGAAQQSTVLTLMISAAFAAPLLSLVNRPPFILNLFGKAKSGKTTALLAAASVIGISEEDALPNWNATDAGLLQIFCAFNDSIVPINELGLLKGKKTDRGERVREIIYAFGEGRDRFRHTASSFAESGNRSPFRGILLSTSESSFHELRAGVRDDGELARAHDVPVLLGGSNNIFDRLSDPLSQKKARLKLNELRRSITNNVGVAFDPYLKWIAQDRDGIANKVRAYVKILRSKSHLCTDDGVLHHSADNFGLCFAGAALAIEAGILPWDLDDTLSALVAAFEVFRDISDRPLDIQQKALRVLRSKLKELKLPVVATIDEQPEDAVILKVGSKRFIIIPSPRFDELFDDAKLARAALVALDEKRRLVKTKKAGAATTENKAWAEVFVKLADGRGKFRAIKFRNSKKLKPRSKKSKLGS